MYKNIGRLVGRSYEESFQLMIKWLKIAEVYKFLKLKYLILVD